ncbi:uncharacterized protein DS421_18g614750 [Arachis hypogaea]|nr:uncharacterized protein DS421_18g614750 [Arachis hypogaea]
MLTNSLNLESLVEIRAFQECDWNWALTRVVSLGIGDWGAGRHFLALSIGPNWPLVGTKALGTGGWALGASDGCWAPGLMFWASKLAILDPGWAFLGLYLCFLIKNFLILDYFKNKNY